MTKLPFSIVGFDLDGTLLDTAQDLGAALNHALAQAGREPVDHAVVSSLIGGGARPMLRRALDLTGGASAAELDALFPVLLDYYEANIAVYTQLYPGGAAMLDALDAAGVRLALVTNKRHTMAVKLLDALGLSHRFGWIMGGGNGYPLKPAPEVLWAMAEQLGGGRAAYVGDTTFDTRAAAAAGMPCVAVRFGFYDLPADELGASAVIDHFDELIPNLVKL